jgi:GNAT superfamily N-acetyltransferase
VTNAAQQSKKSEPVVLSDGTPAITRPITPDDGPALNRGLERLSPAGNAYRFLHYRKRFTETELHYLTHCDFVDHIAVILAIVTDDGTEIDQVGVARCIRDPKDPELAEVAIVLVDEWQRHGGGTALLNRLARMAWAAGIRRWQGFSLAGNTGSEKILATCGTKIAQSSLGHGVVVAYYELSPPN